MQVSYFNVIGCFGKTSGGPSIERRSKGSPVSRVLFGDAATIIPLGRRLLDASSNLPGGMLSSRQSEVPVRRTRSPPVWSCSGWGLPSNRNRFRLWWALNPPFHPYHASLLGSGRSAVSFLWHFPWTCDRSALPTILLIGARTFLPPPLSGRPAIVRRSLRSPKEL